MSAKAARRLLVFAFAISLLVHLVISLVLHPRAPNDEITQVTVNSRPFMHIVEETPRPSPPPTPVPKLRGIARHSAPKPATLHSAVVIARTAGPVVIATGPPAVAALPTPTGATPTPRPCNAPAALSATPDSPDIAPEVRAQMTSGIARILVHLDDAGNILDTTLTASTGNPSLDQVAISMARSASYLPPRAQCKAIAGDYTFSARFAPW